MTISVDYGTCSGNTIEQRDARLVELADAAVLVGDAAEVRGLLARATVKCRTAEIKTAATRREPVEAVEGRGWCGDCRIEGAWRTNHFQDVTADQWQRLFEPMVRMR